MQDVRWRRVAAGLIDFAPFTVALCLVTPLLASIGLAAYESYAGFGIYDPKTGGDPNLLRLNGQHPLALGVFIGALGWLVAQVVVLAQQRGSVGQRACGLVVQRRDGQAASLGRRVLRGSVRQALALALLATAVVGSAAQPPAQLRSAVEQLASPMLALAGALALVLAIDLVLALAGVRGLGDRLAGTALRRR